MHVVDVAHDVLEHGADVRRADEDRLGTGERLAPPRRQLGVAAHRILQLRAVRLDSETRTAGGRDRTAEHDMIREHDVGRQLFTDRRGVQGDVTVAFGGRELRQRPRLDPLVPVEHEHR